MRRGPPKRMQPTQLRATPVWQAEVPPCAPADEMDRGTASQLIRSVRPTSRVRDNDAGAWWGEYESAVLETACSRLPRRRSCRTGCCCPRRSTSHCRVSHCVRGHRGRCDRGQSSERDRCCTARLRWEAASRGGVGEGIAARRRRAPCAGGCVRDLRWPPPEAPSGREWTSASSEGRTTNRACRG